MCSTLPPWSSLNGGLNALTAHIEGIAGSYRVDGEDVEIVLDAANALFGERSVTWAKDFLDTLAANYGADLQVVDFVNATEAAADAINAWVADQTRDKITEIIPEGVLTSLTRLVLVNTLYLKAPWQTPVREVPDQRPPVHAGRVARRCRCRRWTPARGAELAGREATAGRPPSCPTWGASWR